MEVSIERSDCISCGLCVSTCPDVFRIAEDGLAEVYRQPGPEIRRRGLPGQHHLSGGVTGQARQGAAAIGSGPLRFLRLSRFTPSATAHCSPLRKKHLAPSAQLP